MTTPDAAHSLRMVTLNTFGVPFIQQTRARLRTAARALNMANLDAVCLQEVQLAHYVPLLRREFRALPHAAFEPYIYAPKGGLLTLARHALRRCEFHPFRERRLRPGPALADWALYKGALVVELVARATPVIIVNTHLSANYDGDWSPYNFYAQQEHAQLGQLAELIEHCDPAALILVCGDFNIPRGSWLYNDFVARTGVLDPLAEHGKPTFRPLRLMPSRFAQAIDFVFVRPPRDTPVRAQATTLFDERIELINGRHGYVSDHHALRVELAW